MISISILLFSVFYFITNYKKENVEIKILESTTSQVISILKANVDKTKASEKLFESDYINRANSIAYILEKTNNNTPSSEELIKLAKRLNVADIHIVDENGIITHSSVKASIGLDFYADNQLKEFIPLIESEKEDDYYVERDGYDLKHQKEMTYVGVKPLQGGKGMIQISVSPDTITAYEQKTSISTLVESIPVRSYMTVFVVDGESGDILGISKDKEQIIEIGDLDNPEDTVATLKQYIHHPGKIRINGEEKLIQVQEYNGDLVAVSSDSDAIYNSLPETIVLVGFLVIIVITVVIYSLYKLIDRFILQDIETMVNGVDTFLNGKLPVKFQTKKHTELSIMAEGLNKWVSETERRSERISKIASMMGNTLAIYEYFNDLNQYFYSDNLPSILEMSKEECEEMIQDKFLKVIENLDEYEFKDTPREEIFITKSGKYLKMKTIISEATSCAIIRDVSEERQERQKLSRELIMAHEKAARDVLTGLYNRDKVRELIDQWFDANNQFGALLLMDLDNFKKVNDEKGHPEGDALLKKFSDILFKQFRFSDMKARIGGDEFIVFIPNRIKMDVLEDKLNVFLNACRTELKTYYEEQKVSVSIGVAYSDGRIHSYGELYQCADSAMYVAKRQGKDSYYINEDSVICMRNECAYCRKECKRREALFGSK